MLFIFFSFCHFVKRLCNCLYASQFIFCWLFQQIQARTLDPIPAVCKAAKRAVEVITWKPWNQYSCCWHSPSYRNFTFPFEQIWQTSLRWSSLLTNILWTWMWKVAKQVSLTEQPVEGMPKKQEPYIKLQLLGLN